MNNSTIPEVVSKYRNEKTEKIYNWQREAEAIPGIQELKARKNKISQKILLNAIKGIENNDLISELKILEQKEIELLAELKNTYNCKLCNDTGYLNNGYCQCLKDRIYWEVFGAIDIGKLSENFEVSDKTLFSSSYQCINGTSQQAKYIALEKYSKDYAENFPLTKKPNLFLTGKSGLGKTFILRSIAGLVHQKGGDVLLINASELFSVFYKHRLGNDIDLDLLWNCGLLLIDDLGVEPTTSNVTVEYFLDLLNKRIDNKKHTVMATNLSMDNINFRYGERVYSRIRFKDICDQLVFEGMDIRLK